MSLNLLSVVIVPELFILTPVAATSNVVTVPLLSTAKSLAPDFISNDVTLADDCIVTLLASFTDNLPLIVPYTLTVPFDKSTLTFDE